MGIWESLDPALATHIIQAKANMMTIINDTADRMPNSTREIGQKRVDNLKILLSACNWDHIRLACNHVSSLQLSPLTALNFLRNIGNA
jgi:hypothetical protein